MAKFDPLRLDPDFRTALGDTNTYSGKIPTMTFETKNANVIGNIYSQSDRYQTGKGLGYGTEPGKGNKDFNFYSGPRNLPPLPQTDKPQKSVTFGGVQTIPRTGMPSNSGTSSSSFMSGLHPIAAAAEQMKNAQMQTMYYIHSINNATFNNQLTREASLPGIHAGLHAEMKGNAYQGVQQARTAGAQLGQTIGGIPGAVVGSLLAEKAASNPVNLNTAHSGQGMVNPQDTNAVNSATSIQSGTNTT